MNHTERDKLKKRLLQYPDSTEESVNIEIATYEQRQIDKEALINERGLSNAQAEVYLEKTGYPRPPGWHSVFFYPGSYRPRNIIIIWVVIVVSILSFITS